MKHVGVDFAQAIVSQPDEQSPDTAAGGALCSVHINLHRCVTASQTALSCTCACTASRCASGHWRVLHVISANHQRRQHDGLAAMHCMGIGVRLNSLVCAVPCCGHTLQCEPTLQAGMLLHR
jgi:hypothetical protein